MKRLLFITTAFLMVCCTFAQNIVIQGRVTDADSKRPLAGVSVMVAEIGGVTDAAGRFSLTVTDTLLQRTGVSFRFAGYKKIIDPYTASGIYEVEMQAVYEELPAVTVGATGRGILERAIRRIPVNYPARPYTTDGVMRLQYLRNGTDFFNSDAWVQVYHTSVNHPKNASVKLIQNRIDTVTDPSLRFIRWIGGYLSPLHADIVYNEEPFIDLKRINKFRYQLLGTTDYHGRLSYIINFSQNDSTAKEKATGGTLFIDIATLAFAGADISYYNLSGYGVLPKSRLLRHVRYSIQADRWYLQETFVKGNTIFRDESPVSLSSYVTTKINSFDARRFSYADAIQEWDVTQRISKPGDAVSLRETGNLLQNTDRYYELAPLQQMDSLRVAPRMLKKQKQRWRNYFTRDNFRSSLAFIRFPLRTDPDDKSIHGFVNYGFQIGTYFRLYKNLFFHFEGSGNFGTDKVVYSQYGLHLGYEFIFNAKRRPFALSPFAGYNLLSISRRSDYLNGRADYLVYGLKGTLEFSRQVSLFVSLGKNDVPLRGNTTFRTTGYTTAVGIQIKQ